MKSWMMLLVATAMLVACDKDEKEEPAEMPVTRDVRFEVSLAGEYMFCVSVPDTVPWCADHVSGDTIALRNVAPGTAVNMFVGNATTNYAMRIYVDGALFRDTVVVNQDNTVLADTIP